MNKALLFALVVTSAPALAQPVTRPDACGATIAFAPADVRATVEDWLRQESSCNVTLEVRIVPTDGGLYLFARDEQGRVRERHVPDAQSAAVLIASWMADDSKLPAPPPPVLPPRAPALRVPEPHAAIVVAGQPTDSAPVVATSSRHGVVIGAGVLTGHVRGGRVEVDALSWGRWTLGAAASMSESLVWAVEDRESPWRIFDVFDASAVAYIVPRLSLGNWQFRPLVGAGFTYTRTSEDMTDGTDPWNPIHYSMTDDAVVPTAELAVSIGRRFGNWQIDAGPRMTWFGRGPGALQRVPQEALFAALRYRL